MQTRNSKVLTDFIAYCILHPDERFWQALRNWAGVEFVYLAGMERNETQYGPEAIKVYKDTFYLEGKNDVLKAV